MMEDWRHRAEWRILIGMRNDAGDGRPLRIAVSARAYEFARRALALNDMAGDGGPLVELDVISHMDPDTGVRVVRSLTDLDLGASVLAFTSGGDVASVAAALDVDLYLSMDGDSVEHALAAGVPAGHILTRSPIMADDGSGEIRLAFDFDGVLSDDSSDRVFADGGITAFDGHEHALADVPAGPGPLAPFVRGLRAIQHAEDDAVITGMPRSRRLRVAVVTSRGRASCERVMRTMEAWGVRLDSAFFMDGHDKEPVIRAFRPHLFFDDRMTNLEGTIGSAPAVHVPMIVTGDDGRSGDKEDGGEDRG